LLGGESEPIRAVRGERSSLGSGIEKLVVYSGSAGGVANVGAAVLT